MISSKKSTFLKCILMSLGLLIICMGAEAQSPVKKNRECDVKKPQTLTDERKEVDAIFLGRLDGPYDIKIGKKTRTGYKVRTERVWQGPFEQEFFVIDSKTCPVGLQNEKRFLIFGKLAANDVVTVGGEHYSLEVGAEALRYLRQMGNGFSVDGPDNPFRNDKFSCSGGAGLVRRLEFDGTRILTCKSEFEGQIQPMTKYFPSGKIKERGQVKNRHWVGKYEQFDENGKMIASADYDEDGLEKCDIPSRQIKDENLVGYIKTDLFIPIAIQSGNGLSPVREVDLRSVKTVRAVGSDKEYQLEWLELHRDAHSGDCIQSAKIQKDGMADYSILSRRKLNARIPTDADIKRFNSIVTDCVNQGDSADGQNPPCTKPELRLISNIKKEEFWHTRPYKWDMGFDITLINEKGARETLISDCSDCSD